MKKTSIIAGAVVLLLVGLYIGITQPNKFIVGAVNVSIPQSTGYGQVPIGNATGGGYTPVATSTLGFQYRFATSTLSASSPLTGSFIQVGSGGTLGLDTTGTWSGNAGTVTNGVYTTDAGTVFEVPLTFNYPLSRSVNTISFPATSTLYGADGIGGYVVGWDNVSGGLKMIATSTAAGGTNYWTTNVNDIFNNNTANVGVGTSTPWAKLSIGTHNLAITSPSFVIASSSIGVATSTQFIVVNGSVGIGTTTVSAGTLLEVNGAIRFPNNSGGLVSYRPSAQGGAASALIYIDTTDTTLVGHATSRLALRTGTLERLSIDSAGNVGIGTTSPSGVLSINLTDTTKEMVLGLTSNQWVKFKNNGAGGSFRTETSGAMVYQIDSASSTVSGMLFTNQYAQTNAFIATDGTNPTYFNTLGGSVGMGTTTPAQKLTVAGDLGFYGTIPVVSACGGSPTITKGSTDMAGQVTEGTVSTGCVITFGVAKTNAPFCTITGKAGLVFTYAVSATAITITNVGALSSTAIVYNCVQSNN